MIAYNIVVLPTQHRTVSGMEPTKRSGRWDGWDEHGYQPPRPNWTSRSLSTATTPAS